MSNTYWNESLNRNLTKAHGFYNPKVWSANHNQIWAQALKGWKADQIEAAFNEYYLVGKHMPKPSEIIDILKRFYPPKTDRERHDEQIRQQEAKDDGKGCDAIIASAWLILNRVQNGMDIKFEEQDDEPKRVPMTVERAVLICNLEAKRFGLPDSIKATFWLADVWGYSKPRRTTNQKLAAMTSRRKPKSEYGPTPDYSSILRGAAA